MHLLRLLAWTALIVSASTSLPLHAQDSLVRDAPPHGSAHPSAVASPESSRTRLDSLIALAIQANPSLRAAESRQRAAEATVPAAGARPDPMLMLGVMNLPLGGMGFADEMTMKTVGVGQTFPFPGKLGLATRAARHDADAAGAEVTVARRQLVGAVKTAYYELALADQLLTLTSRNRDLLVVLVQSTEASHRVGRAGQDVVLRARVETTRLAEEALALRERRRMALARLNALLNRPSDTPVGAPSIPLAVVRLALADSGAGVRFQTAELGARAAASPLPPLDSLQVLAIAQSPMIAAHEARLAAQEARVALARKETLPDFDVTLQYGQRNDLPDMVTAMISVPIPVQRGRKQLQMVAAAEAERSAEEAEHHAMVNELRERVAGLHGELEQHRTRLALYSISILPQTRAMLAAATSGFRVGRTELGAILDAQAALFNIEAESLRALTEFATSLASLEEIVGTEFLK